MPGVENVGQARLAVAARPRSHRLPLRGRAVRRRARPRARHAGHRPRARVRAQRQRRTVGGGAGVRGGAAAQRRRGRAQGHGRTGTCVRAGSTAVRPSWWPARIRPLVEVTLDDAAGYEEDWTGLKGRGGPVSPARVAVWWEAIARDLVLLLLRGDKPHFAADLAPEGKRARGPPGAGAEGRGRGRAAADHRGGAAADAGRPAHGRLAHTGQRQGAGTRRSRRDHGDRGRRRRVARRPRPQARRPMGGLGDGLGPPHLHHGHVRRPRRHLHLRARAERQPAPPAAWCSRRRSCASPSRREPGPATTRASGTARS